MIPLAHATPIVRRQRSSSTVQPLCLTFSLVHRIVRPPSYVLAESLATRPLVAALDHLRPRLKTIWCQPPHREHQLAPDVLQTGRGERAVGAP
jgi:hypothetical protein